MFQFADRMKGRLMIKVVKDGPGLRAQQRFGSLGFTHAFGSTICKGVRFRKKRLLRNGRLKDNVLSRIAS